MKNWMRCLIGIGAVVASAGLLYGLVLSIICKGLASSEAAGWAQALGTVAAIGVAIWISYDQKLVAGRGARKSELERSVVLATRLRIITVEATVLAWRVIEIVKDEISRQVVRDYGAERRSIDELVSRIAQLEANELDFQRATCIFQLRAALDQLRLILGPTRGRKNPYIASQIDDFVAIKSAVDGADVIAGNLFMEADEKLRAGFAEAAN